MKKVTVTVKPWNVRISADRGSTLLKALSSHGFYLEAPCGGRGTCGSCTVKTYPAAVGQRVEKNTVQACRTSLEEDITVEILPAEPSGDGKKADFTLPSEPAGPGVEYIPLEMTLSDPSCLEEVLRYLPPGTACPENAAPDLLKRLALLAGRHKKITAVVTDGLLTDIRPFDDTARPLGIAVDLGTTTVAGALVDLNTGITLSSAARENRQGSFGSDVISRADHAMQSEENLGLLQRSATETVNLLIHDLKEQAGLAGEDIDETVVAGNPVMQHLLMGVSPALLVKAPYTPVFRHALRVPAGDAGIETGTPRSFLYIAPCVSAYIGGDTLAAVIATGMHRRKKPALLIDIGTNGEIVLGCRDYLSACSAAAGPAFEGARLRHGMSGTRGAVNRMELKDGQITYTVIGSARPVGICGSGVIDAVSIMLDEKIIAPSGAFNMDSKNLRERLVSGEQGEEFILVPAEETAGQKPITLNRKDLGEIQLAKGAIRAGIEILLDNAGITPGDIEEIIMAGTFGNCLSPRSAAALGLWPPCPVEKIRPSGNAAGIGARRFLLSVEERREAERLSQQIEHVNLAAVPGFMEKFSRSLAFV